MAYKKTRDVLDKMRLFHKQLSEFYAQMSERANRQKVKLLLDYMSRHETRLEGCLARYEDSAAKRVLDTWFQFVPPIAKREFFQDMELAPDMSVEDVIRTTIQFDNCLAEFCMQMSETAMSEEVRELFSCLLSMEKREERQAVRDALDM